MKRACVLVLAVVCGTRLSAQITIPGAGDQKVPIVSGPTSLNVEFSKAELGFTYHVLRLDYIGPPPGFQAGCGGLQGYQGLDCKELDEVQKGVRARTDFGARLALAAVDGKRDLFSGGRINPGLTGGFSVRRAFDRQAHECRNDVRFKKDDDGKFIPDRDGDYVIVHGGPNDVADLTANDLPTDPKGNVVTDTIQDGGRYRRDWNANQFVKDRDGPWIETPNGYRRQVRERVCGVLGEHALVGAITGSWKQVKVVEFLDPGQTEVVLRNDRSTKSLGVMLGYERWIHQSHKFGFYARGARNWSSAGPTKPLQVCTQVFEAADTTGAVVTGSKCEDRIAAELVDDFSIQPHLNWLYQFPNDDGPSWGLIAGLSGTFREAYKPTYDAIAGVTLHPDGRPNTVMAAFVFSFKDFTDGNDQNLEFFTDQFSVRLFFAIDLTLM